MQIGLDSFMDEDIKPKQRYRYTKTTALQLNTSKEEENLYKINGIGTFQVFVMNKLGIYSIEQIANWDGEDVKEISTKIRPYNDQFKIGSWIIQAKKLMLNQIYGEIE